MKINLWAWLFVSMSLWVSTSQFHPVKLRDPEAIACLESSTLLSSQGNSTGICAYYKSVIKAFHDADAAALANLFDENIVKPMNQREILAWAKDFFLRHGSATFVLDKLVLEHYDNEAAIALITYHVITSDEGGNFGGTERDNFTRFNGTWLVSGWEPIK
jgi:hypothetical protein